RMARSPSTARRCRRSSCPTRCRRDERRRRPRLVPRRSRAQRGVPARTAGARRAGRTALRAACALRLARRAREESAHLARVLGAGARSAAARVRRHARRGVGRTGLRRARPRRAFRRGVPLGRSARGVLAAMCLIAFALGAHESFAFVVAANRDEFYARETAPAAWWDGKHEIFGGRDLRAGGTWLAIRSEEHTSELQSRENLVCRLLLEKK